MTVSQLVALEDEGRHLLLQLRFLRLRLLRPLEVGQHLLTRRIVFQQLVELDAVADDEVADVRNGGLPARLRAALGIPWALRQPLEVV